MNWVGGARNRVKQQSDRKVQRGYFERKRLANKVQRLRPSLSRVKSSVSQDLLFLKTAVHNAKSNNEKGSPARPPKFVVLESGKRQPTRPTRDLELPMSPIGQPSTLELMDVSTFSSAGQDLSFYPPQRVKEPPKVSTAKVSHNALLDTFEDTMLQGHEKSNVKDLCMTESLFPHGKHKNAHQQSHQLQPPPLAKKQKTYSIDDILNAPRHAIESMLPIRQKESKSSFDPEQYDDHFVAHRNKEAVRKVEYVSKHGAPSKRDGNASSRTGHKQPTALSKSLYTWGRDKQLTDVVSDRDAMLEFHYSQSEEKERGRESGHNKTRPADNQRVPIAQPNLDGLPANLYGTFVGPEDASKSPRVARSSRSFTFLNTESRLKGEGHDTIYSSVLTEDPLSKRNIQRKERKGHDSLVMEAQTEEVVDDRIMEDTHNTTLFNESIFGPIKEHRQKKSKPDSHNRHETSKVDWHSNKASGSSDNHKEMSAFEKMILSMEVNKKGRERKIEPLELGKSTLGPERSKTTRKTIVQEAKCSNVPGIEATLNRHTAWRDFVSGRKRDATVLDESVLGPIHRKKHKSDKKPHTKQPKDYKMSVNQNLPIEKIPQIPKRIIKEKRSVSVLEELMCLEEDLVLNDDRDIALTPAGVYHTEWSEEPVLQRDNPNINRCKLPFDSSQEPMNSSNNIVTETRTVCSPVESQQHDSNYDGVRLIQRERENCCGVPLIQEQQQFGSKEIKEQYSQTHTGTCIAITSNKSSSGVRAPSVGVTVEQAVQTDVTELIDDNNCTKSTNVCVPMVLRQDPTLTQECESVCNIEEKKLEADCEAKKVGLESDGNDEHVDFQPSVDNVTDENQTVTAQCHVTLNPPTDVGGCQTEREGVVESNGEHTEPFVHPTSTGVDVSVQTSPKVDLKETRDSSTETDVDLRSFPSDNNSSNSTNSTCDHDIAKSIDPKFHKTDDPDCTIYPSIKEMPECSQIQKSPSTNNSSNGNTDIIPKSAHQTPQELPNATTCTTVDAGINVTLDSSRLEQLDKDVADLRQELERAQSTIVWQSMMLRLYQMQ